MNLSSLKRKEVLRALESLGFRFHRECANHTIMIRREPSVSILTVPRHRIIGKGLVAAIAKQAGVSADEFMELATR